MNDLVITFIVDHIKAQQLPFVTSTLAYINKAARRLQSIESTVKSLQENFGDGTVPPTLRQRIKKPRV